MAQVPAEKSNFSFSKGLNTDASPLGYPPETTQDEENFELLLDGSRKRRRGLALEDDGDLIGGTTLSSSDVVTTHKWRNAGGLGIDLVVIQSGSDLHFFEDGVTTSAEYWGVISLLGYKVLGATDAEISENPVSTAVGRNLLIVTGRYLQPFYITAASGAVLNAYTFNILEREFADVEDGIALHTQPTGSITAAHRYNLLLRGWKDANITAYASAKSRNPAKNMWPWKGYRRTTVGGIAEQDGTWAFSADKMESELFNSASAGRGHLIINTFDNTVSGSPTLVPITSISIASIPFTQTGTWTITKASHGLSNGNQVVFLGVTVSGTTGSGAPITYTLPGSPYTISNVTTDTFDFVGRRIDSETVVTLGGYSLATAGDVAVNPAPFVTDERPQVTAWYAGRAWYMGIADTKLADKIYFSQLVDAPAKLGRCYQEADPTDPEFNELVPTDGGYITISDLGIPMGAEVYGDSLIIFTTRGLWEISGRNGSFEADNFSVRQLSEAEASSKYSVVKAENTIFWTGPEGIFKLFQDPQTGFLTTLNITEDRISVLWNRIDEVEQLKVKAAYDHGRKRVYFLYQGASGYNVPQYDKVLVYDIRLDAFYKLGFPSDEDTKYITDIFSITSTTDSELNKTIKFVVYDDAGAFQLLICDMDHDDYIDFDDGEQVPYMITGYDNINDWQRQKQAPIIHVFSRRTETGFDEDDGDLVPINPSSILMQACWDWTDRAFNSDLEPVGHFGEQRQVYRHRRYYQPVDDTDTFDDGFPVVVTRNKVRGKGRSLHLRFDGEEGHDAHILGWAIHYKATRKA